METFIHMYYFTITSAKTFFFVSILLISLQFYVLICSLFNLS